MKLNKIFRFNGTDSTKIAKIFGMFFFIKNILSSPLFNFVYKKRHMPTRSMFTSAFSPFRAFLYSISSTLLFGIKKNHICQRKVYFWAKRFGRFWVIFCQQPQMAVKTVGILLIYNTIFRSVLHKRKSMLHL